MRRALYVALAALYLLHNDFWFWRQPRELFGLPAGFVYHVSFCLVASALMAALVSVALPSDDSSSPSTEEPSA